MVHFVGLDVSVKATSVCVVDDGGKVILEQKIPTEPAEIIAVLTSLGVPFGRIGIEAGPLSQWLVNALVAADLLLRRNDDDVTLNITRRQGNVPIVVSR